eukprot:1195520-Prorocentrum_minimum.AAC.8
MPGHSLTTDGCPSPWRRVLPAWGTPRTPSGPAPKRLSWAWSWRLRSTSGCQTAGFSCKYDRPPQTTRKDYSQGLSLGCRIDR